MKKTREIEQKRAALQRLLKLKKYGLMMQGICNNLENTLKFYVSGGTKKISSNSAEIVQTIRIRTLLKFTQENPTRDDTEKPRWDLSTIFLSNEISFEDKIKALVSKPKFLENIELSANSAVKQKTLFLENTVKVHGEDPSFLW